MRTRFCIGQRVVVPGEVVSAGGGDGLKLMVWEGGSIDAARGGKCIMKDVVRVVHLTALLMPGTIPAISP